MHNNSLLKQVMILTPFVFSFALGLDIYIPIIPQMAGIFETTPAIVQLTLSLFLFITGAGQLLIGPLADQFGRKPILLMAACSFIIGSLICAISSQIGVLIVGRAISAFGACGMLVTSFALVRDLYSDRESGKMYSFLNGAIGISPVFAPMIGGHLAVLLGWRAIFYFLAVMGGFALLVSSRCIEETLPPAKRVAVDRSSFSRYSQIFSNRQFLLYATLAGLAEGVFFCFFSISPFIIIDLHGIPTEQFGYYFALFGLVISLGGFASGKMIDKAGISATIAAGIVFLFAGGTTMLLCHYFSGLTLAGFLLPMMLACTGAMFLVGSSAARALEPFAAMAGSASAAFGSIEFGLSALIGSGLMLLPVTSTVPYGVVILITACVCLALCRMSPSVESDTLQQPKFDCI
jgi:Bcr/CflA subfamily drug resistance transporter